MFDVGSVSRREAVRQVLGRIALRCKDGGHGEQPLVDGGKVVDTRKRAKGSYEIMLEG